MPTTPPPVNPVFAALTGANRDAAVALDDLFKSYGIETLAPQIVKFIQSGFSPDTVSILLQQTPEYKQRFAANDARIKAGLPALSPAEYISVENSYRDILSTAGVPTGFYDQPQDFTNWIAGGVSPTEVQHRVNDAMTVVNQADPATLNFFKQHYTTGDMIAYALDAKRAEPLISKQFAAAQIGGQATNQGINIDQNTAEHLAGEGLSSQQAQSGFGVVAQDLTQTARLNAIYGADVSQQDLISQVFDQNAAADQKVKKLASQERATFNGASGANPAALSQSGSAG